MTLLPPAEYRVRTGADPPRVRAAGGGCGRSDGQGRGEMRERLGSRGRTGDHSGRWTVDGCAGA